MPSLVFDFDGVLADTFQVTVDFLSRYMHVSPERAKQFLIQDGMSNKPDNIISKLVKNLYYHRFLRYLKDSETNLVFTAHLDEISRINLRKAIITRNDSRICRLVLGEYADLFEYILGRDTLRSKQEGFIQLANDPDFQTQDCLFFTDSAGDILELSHVLNPHQIYAVSWGFHGKDVLSQYIKEDHIIDSFNFLHKYSA